MDQLKVNQTQRMLLSTFATNVIRQLSGESYEDHVPFVPSNKFFVATLCAQSKKILNSKTKFAPNSLGVEFKVEKSQCEKAELDLIASCVLYYRLMPTYEQQAKSSHSKAASERIMLQTIFKKFHFVPALKRIKLSDIIKKCEKETSVDLGISYQLDKIKEDLSKDPNLFRLGKWKSQKILKSCMSEEDTYNKYLANNFSEVCVPRWSVEVSVKVFDELDAYRFQFVFVNLANKEKGEIYENTAFETRLELSVLNAAFFPFSLDYVKENYKYPAEVSAIGINCSVEEKEGCLVTVHIPSYLQKRIVQRSKESFSMEELSEYPFPVLEKARSELQSGVAAFETEFSHVAKKRGAPKRFADDLKSCKEELTRFELGVEVLKKYPVCLEAFKLMNKSFMLTRKGYKTWRLFQLIFIVSLIPDLASEEYLEIPNKRTEVDLLYFPTGGGKTEAFLGVSVFQAFFDRLTGKKLGVSVITKFPLRMLSLQQLQRVADIFAAAEKVRLKIKSISDSSYDPFAVGYYVGAANTPNDLTVSGFGLGGKPVNKLETMSEAEAQKFLVVERCPFCFEGKVKIKPDAAAIRLKHVCQNCRSELNVFISDSEIYRHLPTFVIATLDKIVICGLQKNFRNILGQVKYKCPQHGYTSLSPLQKRFCIEHTCNVPHDKFIRLENTRRAEPSLIIQDELHLVRERIGALDSHYETLINYLIYKLSKEKRNTKVLAATATISGYEKQISHLYLKNAIKFPSFMEVYAKEEETIQRSIIGIMPHERSKMNSVINLVTRLFIEMQSFERNPTNYLNGISLSEEEKSEIIKNIRAVLSYHIRKQDAAELYRSVRTMVNRELLDFGLREVFPESLTGDVDFEWIRSITGKIEGGEGGIDILTATNLISHGVDLDRLNIMSFMGMPGNNAEYIQAMSRVGRAYPGLVFIVFDPHKEKDQSYYKYFGKFHELQELLIEGAPLNRWSRKALENTVPGVFCASILDYFDLTISQDPPLRLELRRDWKKAFETPLFIKEDLLNFVREALGIKHAPYYWVGEEIEHLINGFINNLVEPESGDADTKPLFAIIKPPPLRNLRNIDTDVTIMPFGDSESVISEYNLTAQKSGKWQGE